MSKPLPSSVMHSAFEVLIQTNPTVLCSRVRRVGGSKLSQNAILIGECAYRPLWARAVASTKAETDRFAKNVLPIIREIQASGVTSQRGIARALNVRGMATARGGHLDRKSAQS
jgi:hypothetical protein